MAEISPIVTALKQNIAQAVVGKDEAVELMLTTLLCEGHLLIEDGQAWFQEHQGRGNGNIASFAGCELIGIVPGGSEPLKKGDRIRVLRLPSRLL